MKVLNRFHKKTLAVLIAAVMLLSNWAATATVAYAASSSGNNMEVEFTASGGVNGPFTLTVKARQQRSSGTRWGSASTLTLDIGDAIILDEASYTSSSTDATVSLSDQKVVISGFSYARNVSNNGLTVTITGARVNTNSETYQNLEGSTNYSVLANTSVITNGTNSLAIPSETVTIQQVPDTSIEWIDTTVSWDAVEGVTSYDYTYWLHPDMEEEPVTGTTEDTTVDLTDYMKGYGAGRYHFHLNVVIGTAGYTLVVVNDYVPGTAITLDMGAGHGDLAGSEDLKACLEEDYGFQNVSAEGTTLTLTVPPKEGDEDVTVGEVQQDLDDAIRSVLGDPATDNGEKYLIVGQEGIDLYDSLEEVQTEIATSTEVIDEGQEFHALWAEPISEVAVTADAPECGTEITGTDASDVTPRPEPAIETEHVIADDALWMDPEDPTSPFIGMIKGGKSYPMNVRLATDFGYYLTSSVTATMNGEECGYDATTETLTAEFEVVHNWGEWAPSTTDSSKEERVCSGCGDKETRNAPGYGIRVTEGGSVNVSSSFGGKSHDFGDVENNAMNFTAYTGSEITFTATANEGYQLKGFYVGEYGPSGFIEGDPGDFISSENPYVFTLSDDLEAKGVYAVFEELVTLKLVPSSREEKIITKDAKGVKVDPIEIVVPKGTTFNNAMKSHDPSWHSTTCPWATGSGGDTGTTIYGYMTHGMVQAGNLSEPFADVAQSDFYSKSMKSNDVLNSDTTVYVPMDIGILSLGINSPVCGARSASGDPQVSVADGSKGYGVDSTGWCRSATEQTSWSGTFQGDKTYYARVWLTNSYGYRLIYDQQDCVTVWNGECTKVYQVFPSSYSGIIVGVKAEHVWSDWAEDQDKHVLFRACSGCGEREEAVAYNVEQEKYYETLAEAVEDAAADETIQMVGMHSVTQTVVIDKDLTLDLNGKMISSAVPTSANGTIKITSDSEVTIKDDSTDKKGVIRNNGGNLNWGTAVRSDGTLKLESGSLTAGFNAYCLVIGKSGSAELNGGSLLAENYVTVFCNGEVTVNEGASIIGPVFPLEVEDGEATINGGLLFSDGGASNRSAIENRSGVVIVNGGTIIGPNGMNIRGNGRTSVPKDSTAVVKATGPAEKNSALVMEGESGSYVIAGGWYSDKVKEEYVADGYVATDEMPEDVRLDEDAPFTVTQVFTITYELPKGLKNSPDNPTEYTVLTIPVELVDATPESAEAGTFGGWYTDSKYQKRITSIEDVKGGNLTLYAKLIPNEVALKSVTASNVTYNGKAQKPAVTVKDANGKTVAAKNYTVTYAKNTNVGTATVTVTAKSGSGYSGTLKGSFKILAASIAKAKVTGISDKAYNGKAQTPAPTVKLSVGGSTKTLKKGTDYTVAYKNNKLIGTATVTITGKGNYKDSVKKTFKIQLNGVYQVASNTNNAYVWDIAGASKLDRAKLQLYKKNGTKAQQFRITPVGKHVKIINVASGKAIDVPGGRAVTRNNLQQFDWNGTKSQLWEVEQNANGTIVFHSTIDRNYVIDLHGNIAENKKNIWLFPENKTSAQKWVMNLLG